ncbi:hypothetical protein FD21_GL001901 [Liquorilactobacillus vini DSM 20605]|uniref:Uncharacterized protein n=1 Tax=Liquorilactobacillus vini DSM 20605 TaxID=1133569 RepID=A0A0R2CC25_9LACO|nr:hypothetical protein FD21_GL001901 [Liquorilactobacillus vini DSM 20605]
MQVAIFNNCNQGGTAFVDVLLKQKTVSKGLFLSKTKIPFKKRWGIVKDSSEIQISDDGQIQIKLIHSVQRLVLKIHRSPQSVGN